jgi:hypothetical protein
LDLFPENSPGFDTFIVEPKKAALGAGFVKSSLMVGEDRTNSKAVTFLMSVSCDTMAFLESLRSE